MDGHFLFVFVLAAVMAPNTIGSSVSELCGSGRGNSEGLSDLCGAKMEVDALQERLEGMADRILQENGGQVEKRKNEFVRFGRSGGDEGSYEVGHDMGKRKNEFVRFGKRKNEFVRFGKRKNEFVRFGKKSDDGVEKRKNEFVRFG